VVEMCGVGGGQQRIATWCERSPFRVT
jgi:hypothetical protein